MIVLRNIRGYLGIRRRICLKTFIGIEFSRGFVLKYFFETDLYT